MNAERVLYVKFDEADDVWSACAVDFVRMEYASLGPPNGDSREAGIKALNVKL